MEDTGDRIERLQQFKKYVERWKNRSPYDEGLPALRSRINEDLMWVQREVVEAGCFKTFTVGPPPALGGMVMQGVDPFEALFNPPYGVNTASMVMDMVDQTIGVLRSPRKQPPTVPQLTEAPEPGFAFVAMPINPADPALDDVLDAIKAACSELSIHAERVDEAASNDRITDRILESIRRAEFVIVDLTHGRRNVFYEAGYAHGIGKTPIYVAREGTKLEFDLKDYPVIFFNNMRELRTRLNSRLSGLRGA